MPKQCESPVSPRRAAERFVEGIDAMEITTQRQGAVTVVRPAGALLEPDAEQVKATLLQTASANLGRVVLDMEDIPFVDSRGLEVLVEVREELSEGGQVLKLCAA